MNKSHIADKFPYTNNGLKKNIFHGKINTKTVFILRSAGNDACANFCSLSTLANAHTHFTIIRRLALRAAMVK